MLSLESSQLGPASLWHQVHVRWEPSSLSMGQRASPGRHTLPPLPGVAATSDTKDGAGLSVRRMSQGRWLTSYLSAAGRTHIFIGWTCVLNITIVWNDYEVSGPLPPKQPFRIHPCDAPLAHLWGSPVWELIKCVLSRGWLTKTGGLKAGKGSSARRLGKTSWGWEKRVGALPSLVHSLCCVVPGK